MPRRGRHGTANAALSGPADDLDGLKDKIAALDRKREAIGRDYGKSIGRLQVVALAAIVATIAMAVASAWNDTARESQKEGCLNRDLDALTMKRPIPSDIHKKVMAAIKKCLHP